MEIIISVLYACIAGWVLMGATAGIGLIALNMADNAQENEKLGGWGMNKTGPKDVEPTNTFTDYMGGHK